MFTLNSNPILFGNRHSTIETNKAARIRYDGFLVPHEYSDECQGAWIFNNDHNPYLQLYGSLRDIHETVT